MKRSIILVIGCKEGVLNSTNLEVFLTAMSRFAKNGDRQPVKGLAERLAESSPQMRHLFVRTINLHLAPTFGQSVTAKRKKERILEALQDSLEEGEEANT